MLQSLLVVLAGQEVLHRITMGQHVSYSPFRKENAAFKSRVMVCEGSLELLEACGFKDRGKRLPPGRTRTALTRRALFPHSVQSLIQGGKGHVSCTVCCSCRAAHCTEYELLLQAVSSCSLRVLSHRIALVPCKMSRSLVSLL